MYDEDDGRDKLARTLERNTMKLQSRMKGHFVDDKSICTTCDWATITRQASKNRRVIRCSCISGIMPDDIVECTDYKAKTELSLNQMTGIATLIDIDGRKVGFRGGND